MTVCNWKFAGTIGIVAVLLGLESQIDYESLCDVSCLEAEVNKYRVDPWDVQFLKSRICVLRNITKCRNKVEVVKQQDPWEYQICRYRGKKKDCYKFITTFQDLKDKLIKYRKEAFFVFSYDVQFVGWYSERLSWMLMYEHHHRRFSYHDPLGFGVWSSPQPLTVYVDVDKNFRTILSPEESANLVTLLLIRLNIDSGEIDNINVHTRVFDQTGVIFSDGSLYYAYFSICMSFVTIVILFYFIYNLCSELSLLGTRKCFSFDPLHVPYQKQLFTRPDLIGVELEGLNIFASYFWRGILEEHGMLDSVLFAVSVTTFGVFTNLIAQPGGYAYNLMKLLPQINFPWYMYCYQLYFQWFILLLSIYVLFMKYFRILICFLSCFCLSLFIPELLFDSMHIIEKLNISTQLPLYFLFCLLVILLTLVAVVYLFYARNLLMNWLNDRKLLSVFLWPIWPIRCLISITMLYLTILKAKRTLLHQLVFTFYLFVFCYAGYRYVPAMFRYLYTLENHTFTFSLNLSVIGYWLFVPLYILVSDLSDCLSAENFKKYHSWIMSNVLSFSFCLCMTLFAVYLCNFYLQPLYPTLQLHVVKPDCGSFLTLWIPVIFTLLAYVLEIGRCHYNNYETYLKSVLSHIRKTEGSGESSRNIERLNIVYDSNVLVYKEGQGQYRIVDDKCYIKGLLIFIRDGRIFVPSDFFFSIIKLPGGPGTIKSVLMKEIRILMLRLFPAVFIYWVRETVQIVELEDYKLMLQALLNTTLLNIYKAIFLNRKPTAVDLNTNIALQHELDKFVGNYYSWTFYCPNLGSVDR